MARLSDEDTVTEAPKSDGPTTTEQARAFVLGAFSAACERSDWEEVTRILHAAEDIAEARGELFGVMGAAAMAAYLRWLEAARTAAHAIEQMHKLDAAHEATGCTCGLSLGAMFAQTMRGRGGAS